MSSIIALSIFVKSFCSTLSSSFVDRGIMLLYKYDEMPISDEIIALCQAAKEIVSICTPLLLQKMAFDILQNRNYILSNNKKICLEMLLL